MFKRLQWYGFAEFEVYDSRFTQIIAVKDSNHFMVNQLFAIAIAQAYSAYKLPFAPHYAQFLMWQNRMLPSSEQAFASHASLDLVRANFCSYPCGDLDFVSHVTCIKNHLNQFQFGRRA